MSARGTKRSAVVGIGLLLAVLASCADVKPPSAFEQAFDDDTKPWQEIQTQLPAAPQDANLVYFAVSAGTPYRFAVDATSLAIGSDGVFRYVLVATSPQGARNVSYEGIRCESHERKIYAIGRTDGSWARSRAAAWLPIEDVSSNRQHAALMKEYFCPDDYPARNPAEVLARMRVRVEPTNTT